MNENEKVDEVMHLLTGDCREIVAVIHELSFLETEAKSKKAKLNRLREVIRNRLDNADAKNFSEENRAKVVNLLRARCLDGGLRELERLRWQRICLEKEEIENWKVRVTFDHPKPLRIWLSFPDLSSKVIDIIASIKEDIANIGNPFIIKAIDRYRKITAFQKPPKNKVKLRRNFKIPLGSDQAFACLDEICKALKMPKNSPKSLTKLTGIFDSKLNSLVYGLDKFGKICDLLKSNTVKTSRSVSNKVMYIRVGLERAFPEIDFQDALSWLDIRLRENALPRRTDASTLRNDYYSWKWKVSTGSAKIYLTKIRQRTEIWSRVDFAEVDSNKWSEARLFNFTGIFETPFYDDISNLVTVDLALEDLEVLELAPQD